MDLDDLKNAWDEINTQEKCKQSLTYKIFDKMNKEKFRSPLNKIILPETFGSIVCLLSAAFIGFNFQKLDKISLQIAGIVGILLFLILPIISLISVYQLQKAGNMSRSYTETLKDFAVQKIKFCKLQKLNLTLSYLLLVTVILLSTRLFGRNEITDSKYFFVFAFTLGYSFLILFSSFVFKGYNKAISQTEDLLREL